MRDGQSEGVREGEGKGGARENRSRFVVSGDLLGLEWRGADC